MSAWHELVERDHDIQNPTSVEKIRLLGSYRKTTGIAMRAFTGEPPSRQAAAR